MDILFADQQVSIHASAWEATRKVSIRRRRLRRFQSTPPRGRRRQDWADAAARLGFQSTPPRGRRPDSATAAMAR